MMGRLARHHRSGHSRPVDITVVFQGYDITEIIKPVGDEVVFTSVMLKFGTIVIVILAAAIMAVSARSGLSIVPRC